MTANLRGVRYLNNNPEFAKELTEVLPYLEYQETLAWYDAKIIEAKCDRTAADKMRALCGCNDRFFLLSYLLNRKDARHPWVFERCREVEANPDGHIDLWARYHYKSTIITFAGVIQEILNDPELTVAIFSHSKPIATAFLEQIKRELEDNEYLKKLYSDVLWESPRVEAPKWSNDGIIVKRASNPRECTVEAHGLVDGQPVSRHYGLLVYDDIVTEKAITNETQIRKTTLAWEQSDNLSKSDGVRKQMAGTRWHFGDTYGIIIESSALKSRIYPATEDGTLNGRPVFLSQERWDEVKKTQRSTCSAQMLLNPVAGNDAVFLTEWFRPYQIFPPIMNVYILCDPSKGKRRSGNSAGSDRTAIAVIGIDPAGNKFLLDGYRHRMKLKERWDRLKDLYDKWTRHPGVQFVRVGYEVYGAQVDTEVIEEYQQRDNIFFPVEELNFPREGRHSKRDRVERLEPDMRSGRFYLPAVVWHQGVSIRPGDNDCLWSVWSELDAQKARAAGRKSDYNVGQIVYRPLIRLTKNQAHHMDTGQAHRVVRAIRRFDEEGEIYDLTCAFMEEARSFPYAPHDDLIDATARIFDIDPSRPSMHESRDTEGLSEDMIGGAVDTTDYFADA